MTCHDQGLCRVGWSTSQAALDLGVLSAFQTLNAATYAQVKRYRLLILRNLALQELTSMALVLEGLERNPTISSLTAMER